MSHRTCTLFVFLAAAFAIAACHPSARLQTPDGFAELEDQEEYAYRAASADGVVLGVRAVSNAPKGNIDFWVGAVDTKLRKTGYAPDEDGASREVTSATGLGGRELRYVRQEGGRPYRFWVAVFVTDQKVFLVEAGGDEARFDPRTRARVEKAIASVTL